MTVPRLFVALELPDHVRDALDRGVAPWREGLKGVRWGPSENWHVTLLFLGATEEARIPWIEEQLAEAARPTPSFTTSVDRFGAFPTVRRASIVWAGLDDAEGHIARLATAVADTLETPLEHEPFSAHVTVGRAHRPIRLPDGFVNAGIDGDPFEVAGVVLFRSHLGGGPPRYEALSRLPLGAG